MALSKWDPFAELDTLHSHLDNWFNSAVANPVSGLAMHAPVTDVYSEDDKHIQVEVHLPNFAEKEVNVDVHDHTLEIKADHSEKKEDKDKRQYMLRESSSSFYRRIALPVNADEDKIKAHFADGMLKVTVPLKELPKPKKITIGTGKKSK